MLKKIILHELLNLLQIILFTTMFYNDAKLC